VEFVREPDQQLVGRTGPLHMGQWLSLPMIALGILLIVRALRRPLVPDGGIALEADDGNLAVAS
jgi:phosphatidylglycerol:prolipoprotein diacylglycerol transferase